MARGRPPRDQRANQRPSINTRTRLYVPESAVPEDKVWRWVSESVHNAPNDGRVSEVMMAGWSPVDGAKHPEMVPPPLPGREKDPHNLIRRGGQILMEIDKFTHEERVREQEIDANQSVDAISTAVDGPGMSDDDRLVVHNNTTKFDHRRPFKT